MSRRRREEEDEEEQQQRRVELHLSNRPRREEVDSSELLDIMERLPDDVGHRPGNTRYEFRFRDVAENGDVRREGSMIVDVDPSPSFSGERRGRKQREPGVPVYDLRLNQVADNVLPEWYATAIVALAYRWALTREGLRPDPQHDRGRVMMTTAGESRVFSTETVPIAELSDTIVESIARALQSNEAVDPNRNLLANVQIMLERRGGAGRSQMFTQVEEYFSRQVLCDPDWVQQPGENMCMLLAVLMSPARATNPETGELTVGDIEVPGLPFRVCADVNRDEEVGPRLGVDTLRLLFEQRRMEYMRQALEIYLKLHETHRDLPQPGRWVEADLEKLAALLQVCIHVLVYEAGAQQVKVYGSEFQWRHVYILRKGDHYLAVRRPNVLFLNQIRSGKWNANNDGTKFCDRCLSACTHGDLHRRKCLQTPIQEDTMEILYQRKMDLQHASPFLDRSIRSGTRMAYCNTCHRALGVIKRPPKDMESSPAEDYYRDCIWTMRSDEEQAKYDACFASDHKLIALPYRVCANCHAELPVPYHHQRKFEYLNRHTCVCQRPRALKVGDPKSYWLWDLECLQQPVEGVVELPAILVCAMNMADPNDRLEFRGFDCMDDFMRTILREQRFEKTTWIAHNGAKFDVQYVCRWLNRNGIQYESVCVPGSMHAFQEVTVRGDQLRFIDSFKFIPVALGSFAKTFGLSGDFAKGDFPLRFATLEHLDYAGPMPPLDEDGHDWYNLKMRGRAVDPETSRREVDAFREWHAQESRKYWTPEDPTKPLWRFWDELRKYCWQDVRVLREGCLVFRQDFLEGGEPIHGWTPRPVDPFQYVSIPQCLQAWCLAGLPEGEEIAAIPRIPKIEQRQSKKALHWLLTRQEELRRELGAGRAFKIHHVWNSPTGREYYLSLPASGEVAGSGRLGGFIPVDGYAYAFGRRYIFQFHGCYWHGCRKCYGDRWEELHPHRQVPFKQLYYHTQLVREKIRQYYPDDVYEEIWECEYDQQLRERGSPSPYTLLHTDVMTDRDVFFGGRVEAFQNLCIADLDKGEEIRYIDVVSHYPNICAFYRLCTGHPQRLLGPEIDMARLDPAHPHRYFGFFRGFIVPRADDKYGGLPKKGDQDQLIFSNEPGVYCGFLEELYERLEHGARIEEMYEILHFDEENSRVGPFYGYMAHSFRDKMEASGWDDLTRDTPFEGQELTDEVKAQLAEYLERENKGLCRLRPEKVEKNKGKRYMAKLRINSLWGKFVQKDSTTERIRVQDYATYFDVMHSPKIDPRSISFHRVTDSLFECTYKWTETFVQRGARINPYLGASVTGWARTILHRKVREVDAIYCDTDSVIYKHSPSRPPVTEIGAGIGQWQNEFSGLRVERFYALGPKCYCLVFDRPDENGATYMIKAKGVTMHASNHAMVTPDDFLRVILANYDANQQKAVPEMMPRIRVQAFHIGKDIHNKTHQPDGNVPMIVIHTTKDLRCTFTKRKPVRFYGNDYWDVPTLLSEVPRLLPNLVTVPFGYSSGDSSEDVSRQFYPEYYEALRERRMNM